MMDADPVSAKDIGSSNRSLSVPLLRMSRFPSWHRPQPSPWNRTRRNGVKLALSHSIAKPFRQVSCQIWAPTMVMPSPKTSGGSGAARTTAPVVGSSWRS